jgi:hypothetical protein
MAAVFGVAELERIVAFARKYPVFPCAQNKSPLVKSGFHAASQDVSVIRAWWRQWPDALVGVPTGQGTNLVVVDYDPDKATQATHAWIAEHTDLLCSTRSHKTVRGGLHYVFRSTDRYQTGTNLMLGGSPRNGLDLRANGGYMIWWPLHGGDFIGDTIAPLPAGLIEERRFVEARDLAPLPTAKPAHWAAERDRAEAALAHLHPDGYEQWIRVGMALHHASGGSDEGFAVWHQWSAKGETYDGIEDCRYHWASFGGFNGRALGLGTLYAAAKAAGFDPAPARQELPPLEAYADEPELAANAPAKPKATSGGAAIKLRAIHEIVAEQREPEWLLHRILEAHVLAVLAGPRGTFKSFIGLDWAMRVAESGQPVVILSGEGAGLDRRADAWRRTHRPDLDFATLPMVAVERPVNLRLAVELAELALAIETLPKPPGLVVVDTFSKFSAGIDENDNGEVSAYLAGLTEYLRDAFACSVLLVAHSGHGDAKRPRGASALMANPDAEYIVDRPPGMFVSVTRDRFKDSPALEPLAYEAKTVDLGRIDAYGESVTSLALVSTGPPPRTLRQPTGKAQKQLLAGLRNLQRDSKDRLFWSLAELRAIARGSGMPKQTAHDAVESVAFGGFLTAVAGGGYSLPIEELPREKH